MSIDSTVRLVGGNGYSVTLTNSGQQLHRQPGGGGWGMAPVVNAWFEGAGDGELLSSTRRSGRQLTIPVSAFGATRDEVQTNIRNLVRVIRDPFTIYVDYDDGSSYYIGAVYTDGAEGVYGAAPEMQADMSLTFLCPDPYWTSVQTQSFTVAPASAGPLLPDLAQLQVASSSAFGTTTITNTGDVSSNPTWKIQGPGNAITLAIGSKSLTLNTTLTSSDLVTIQFTNGGWTVTNASGVNLYGSLSPAPTFPTIPRGTTTATVQMAGTAIGSYISATYPERREVAY